MNPNVAGALINSALYLVCVFVAGMVTGHAIAWRLAIAAIGVAFLSHIVQLMTPRVRPLDIGFVLASWLVAIAAGIALLF